MNITELMAGLVLQIGIILFAARIFGRLIKRIGAPPVLGELLSGMIIGPYALGSIPLPGFPAGIFPQGVLAGSGPLVVSAELYGFAVVAFIILLFASGLETNLALLLRYSAAGSVIGTGGAACSFIAGGLVGSILLHTDFMDARCLFLGILSTAASAGVIARILSDQEKMGSPEGATILAAAVFDDVWGIILLAVVLGILPFVTGGEGAPGIFAAAGKAFGVWLGFTVLGLVFSKQIAWVLKRFKHSFDFSILALGLALLLAGVFEKQGLAMIIGAYIAGLSLAKTDIAPVIQERIRGFYKFFVPLFFSVMGMMVDVREIASVRALVFGFVYAAAAIVSKVIGCGGSALLLGFNGRGALRIGAGMAPRGEVTLVIAGIALVSGILDSRLFGAVILMTFVTTLAAPPLLSLSFKMTGAGTRKPGKSGDTVSSSWEFSSREIAGMVVSALLKDLRNEGFYVQTMNLNGRLFQARKDDIVLSVFRKGNSVTIETDKVDMPFVKTAVYEVILGLSDGLEKLKKSADPQDMKKELDGMDGRAGEDVLALIKSDCITLNLKGGNKEEVLTELVDLLDNQGRLDDRDLVLEDILRRERTMSTGMQHGIALPHARSDGVSEICAAVGVKKEGINFDSLDGEKSRLFIMIISPRKTSGPHVQFLAAVGTVLKDEITRDEVINAGNAEYAAMLLRRGR